MSRRPPPLVLAEVLLHHERLLVIDVLGLGQGGAMGLPEVDPKTLPDTVRHGARPGQDEVDIDAVGICWAFSFAGNSGEGAREKFSREISFGFALTNASIEACVSGDCPRRR